MFSQGYYLPFSLAFHQMPFQGALPSTAPGETAVVVPATATEKKKEQVVRDRGENSNRSLRGKRREVKI